MAFNRSTVAETKFARTPATAQLRAQVASADSEVGTGIGSDRGLMIPPVPNLPPVQCHPIDVNDLPGVIKQMSANSDFAFSEEYDCIEQGNEFSREASLLIQNKTKNRYANILPYDYSRIRLSLLGDDQYSDYINANWLIGYKNGGGQTHKHYIAAQGPTGQTCIDFWRMLWECAVPVVAMVTNCEEKGRVKCHRYWPASVGEELDLMEQFSVILQSQDEFPEFVIRKFLIQNQDTKRTLIQFHYIAWPDHGVPESTAGILTMLKKCRDARTASSGPMLVHCSAGVGRTGTLISIDINLDRHADDGSIDVFESLNTMRRGRSTMVQTEEQYIFIYKALADACGTAANNMNIDELRAHYNAFGKVLSTGITSLETEFKKLAQGAGAGPNVRTDSAQLPVNKAKNRFQNILPYENSRVHLQMVPGVTGSDYINASFIDGFTQRGSFIATQGPLDTTLPDVRA